LLLLYADSLTTNMLKSGWMRLWIVTTALLFVTTLVAASVYVWGRDVSYRFVTVSIADTVEPQDRQLAERMKQEATAKTFTGKFPYSPLLTLESLAKRKAVTQVSVEWLEPSGWSSKDHDEIDIFNQSDIKASEIIRRVSHCVHRARLHEAILLVIAVIAVSAAVLAVGIGVTWIRKGFAAQ
jgi:hypothetical protein